MSLRDLIDLMSPFSKSAPAPKVADYCVWPRTEPLWDFRDLTQNERNVIAKLIGNSGDYRQQLEAELPLIKVVSRCGCGCPSIDFGFNPRDQRSAGREVSSGSVSKPEGRYINVALLLDEEGRLGSLDASAFGTIEGPFALPSADEISLDKVYRDDELIQADAYD